MKVAFLVTMVSAAALAISTGCGSAPASNALQPNSSSASAKSVDASLYQLTVEPDGAVGVIAARESASDGDPLVLVGRIGGAANPWIEGRAAFTLLDASMSVVAEGEDSEESELCMGDCCATERLNCTALVKIVDDQGKLLPVDSRELLGLNEADMLVIQGHAKRDKSGNFVMLAKGIYVRK